MGMEMPPAPPEKKEREPITDTQCVEAMKTGNFELVDNWYAEQQEISKQFGQEGRLNLVIKEVSLQIEAGLLDYARETLGSLDQVAQINFTQEQREEIQKLASRLG